MRGFGEGGSGRKRGERAIDKLLEEVAKLRGELLQHRGRRGGIEGVLAKVLIEGRGVGEKSLRQRVLRGIEEDQRLLLLL